MAHEIRCPSCQQPLQVPDDLANESVACPRCHTAFMASPPGSPKAESPRLENLEEDVDEGDYEERPRRRRRGRRRRRREHARSLVLGPAIGLLVTACLGYVGTVYQIVQLIVTISSRSNAPGPANPSYEMGRMIGAGTMILMYLTGSTILLIGALRMKNLQDFGYARTSSIMAMLPCWGFCLLGLPMGIWALVVLNNPEVRDAFS